MQVEYFELKLDTIEVNISLLLVVCTLVHFMVVNCMGGKKRKVCFSDELMEKFKEKHS